MCGHIIPGLIPDAEGIQLVFVMSSRHLFFFPSSCLVNMLKCYYVGCCLSLCDCAATAAAFSLSLITKAYQAISLLNDYALQN
jgi:hypothetical protein